MEFNTKIEAINITDFQQKSINLIEEFKGIPLLLIIYNNRCLGCTGRAIPLAYDLQQEFKAIKVIGIHSDFNNENTTEDDIKSIFTINDLPFPIFIDKDHKVYDQFNSEGTPQWLLINSNGILERSIFGSQSGSKNRLLYAIESIIN